MQRVGMLLSASIICMLVAGARGGDQVNLPLDNAFLVKAATCDFAVIEISKMAETQASPDIKAFAVHIGKDHQASYDKLAGLLKTRKVGVVSGTEPGTKAEIKLLGGLKGADFDREFLKWIIQEHRAGVPISENQINQGKDADVRAFAKENLETARKHLQEAEELAKTIRPR